MLSIGMHMRLIGHPARAAGLQRLLDHIARFDGVWVTRRLDIARHWVANFPGARCRGLPLALIRRPMIRRGQKRER